MPPATDRIVLCGSLSLHPVSMGAAMHRAAYEATGLPWAYVPFAMTSDRLRSALDGMRALGIRGFGVSMPFKIEVFGLVDRVDALAERIGACNTIVNEDGTLVGHNTDAEGAARALEEAGVDLRGARCLVLGAGGAARAVAFGVAARGAKVAIANRTRSKADDLARAVGADVVDWQLATRSNPGFDVVVQATSAGMDKGSGPEESPLEAGALGAGLVVMDIVYKPVETKLLALARASGARAIHGGRMLLYQAARQFELYTGLGAPLAAMDAALRAAIDPAASVPANR